MAHAMTATLPAEITREGVTWALSVATVGKAILADTPCGVGLMLNVPADQDLDCPFTLLWLLDAEIERHRPSLAGNGVLGAAA